MKKSFWVLCTTFSFLTVALFAIFMFGAPQEAKAQDCDPILAYRAAVAISPECPAGPIYYFCSASVRSIFLANNPCYVPAGTGMHPECQVFCTP